MKVITIHSPDHLSSARFIPEKGGLMTSLKMPDPARPGKTRELLYLPEDFNVATYHKIGVAWPFCFPICGRLKREGKSAYLYQHHPCMMEIHGFAHTLPWEVVAHSEHMLTLRLLASAQSRKQYPFDFEVLLSYTLNNAELLCQQTYTNPGEQPLPYYAGFHPYFWIDPSRYAKSEVLLECAPVKRLQYNEALTDIVGEQALFQLPIAISEPIVNESLLQLGSDHNVRLKFPDQSILEMSVTGVEDPTLFSYLQLYHIPAQAFFCIEPWMSHPNALNTVNAARLLCSGEIEQAILQLRLYSSKSI